MSQHNNHHKNIWLFHQNIEPICGCSRLSLRSIVGRAGQNFLKPCTGTTVPRGGAVSSQGERRVNAAYSGAHAACCCTMVGVLVSSIHRQHVYSPVATIVGIKSAAYSAFRRVSY